METELRDDDEDDYGYEDDLEDEDVSEPYEMYIKKIDVDELRKNSPVVLDICKKLLRSITSSQTYRGVMTYRRFKRKVVEWYKDHGQILESRRYRGIQKLFHLIDKDRTRKLSRAEIEDFVMALVDKDHNGKWSLPEFKVFVTNYAKQHNRVLTFSDWDAFLKGKGLFSNGVTEMSYTDLKAKLAPGSKRSFSSLSEWIISNSKPIKLDLIEYGGLFYEAMNKDGVKGDSITKAEWMRVVEKVFVEHKIPWEGDDGDGNRDMTE